MTVGSTGPGSRSATFSRPRVSSQRAAIRAPMCSISGRSGPGRSCAARASPAAARRAAGREHLGRRRASGACPVLGRSPRLRPAAGSPGSGGATAAAGSVPGSASTNSRQKSTSSWPTVSASQTSRSAWFPPYGGSTPQTCTRTPYACAASTAGTMSSSPASRTTSVTARCRASTSRSWRTWASTPFCWPAELRLPSRTLTCGRAAIWRCSTVGTRSRAASYQYIRSSSPGTYRARPGRSARGSAARRRPGSRAGTSVPSTSWPTEAYR